MIDRKLVLLLAPVGLFMGTLMILGLAVPTLYISGWVIFSILAVWQMRKRATPKWFLHSLLIGVVWGLLHNTLESIFFEQYLSNNPGYDERLSNPEFIPIRLWVLLTAFPAGLGTGMMIVVFYLLAKLIPKKIICCSFEYVELT